MKSRSRIPIQDVVVRMFPFLQGGVHIIDSVHGIWEEKALVGCNREKDVCTLLEKNTELGQMCFMNFPSLEKASQLLPSCTLHQVYIYITGCPL